MTLNNGRNWINEYKNKRRSIRRDKKGERLSKVKDMVKKYDAKQKAIQKQYNNKDLENKIPTLLNGSANLAIDYAANEVARGEVIGVQSK